jgi:adenylate cyclase
VTADERLSGEELAAQTGSSPAVIGELAAAGILRSGPDGLYGNGDMQRVLVASALVDAGLSVELMRRGIEAGVVSFEDTDVIYASPGRLSLSASELAAEVGLGTETVLRIITALGISRPDPETPLHEPDVEQLRAFVEAWRPLADDDLLVRAARVYGDALRRAAEGWLGIYEDVVLAPLATRAVPWDEMRVLALEPGLPLLAVGRSMLPWLVDQHLFRLLNQMNFDSIERQLALLGIAPAAPWEPSAIVFTDLAGFTRLTEERGDEAAAASATRLAVIADEVARKHDGRLVKLLGDGVMLHFARAAHAVPAALELHRSMEPDGLPPAHSGIHAGRVIRRESDFFGRTMNIAARLAAVAGPDEILVTDELVGAVPAAGADLPRLVALSPLELKGIPEPITAYRVADSSSAAASSV